MARANIFNAFVCVSALAQVQYAVQDGGTTPIEGAKNLDAWDAPSHPRVVNSSATYMFISWQPPNDTTDELYNYIVNYYENRNQKDPDRYLQKTVGENSTTCFLKGLNPGTRYKFFVQANYTSGHKSKSITVSFMITGYGADNPCNCNMYGTNSGMYDQCDSVSGQCECKNKYHTGRQCDDCTKQAYWHPRLGCQYCDCESGKTSDGTCYINKDNLKMCRCRNHHSGPECVGCMNGFYLVGGVECQPCNCNGNENRTTGSRICDDRSGDCLSCGYNTAGKKCELCKPGFIGSAIARNCTYDVSVPYGESAEKVNHNLVIGLTLGLITVITVTIIIMAYLKCRRRKKPFNFWTVQLRDDHENVNFSSMMEQDYSYNDSNCLDGSRPGSQASQHEKTQSKTSSGNVYRPVKT